MNDDLIHRWRSGEPTATTAVRNGVRSIAERVLGHPMLVQSVGPAAAAQLGREDRRRELTSEVAREVMSRRVDSAAQLTAMALVVAGRHAVEALQKAHPPIEGAHLPPQVAVTLALAPGGLVGGVRDAAERHLAECSHCVEDLRLIARIAAAQEASDPDGPDHDDIAEEARRVEALFAEAEADLQAPAPSAAQARRTASAARGGRRVLPAPPKPRRAWLLALPVLVLVGLGLWLARAPESPVSRGPVAGLAELADRSPPEVARLGDLPSEVQFAVADLSRGDCKTAAGRFRSARGRAPKELRLFLLEGASFICANEGSKALKVFAELEAELPEGQEPPRALHWYKAQAHLLQGEADPALAQLQQAAIHDAGHRKAADEQISRVRALLQAP